MTRALQGTLEKKSSNQQRSQLTSIQSCNLFSHMSKRKESTTTNQTGKYSSIRDVWLRLAVVRKGPL